MALCRLQVQEVKKGARESSAKVGSAEAECGKDVGEAGNHFGIRRPRISSLRAYDQTRSLHGQRMRPVRRQVQISIYLSRYSARRVYSVVFCSIYRYAVAN